MKKIESESQTLLREDKAALMAPGSSWALEASRSLHEFQRGWDAAFKLLREKARGNLLRMISEEELHLYSRRHPPLPSYECFKERE